MKKQIMIFIASIFAGMSVCGNISAQNTNGLNLRFFNSTTGNAVIPKLVEIKSRTNLGNNFLIGQEKINRYGTVSLKLLNGVYDFSVAADGYFPMTTYNEITNQTLNINFNLEPIISPQGLSGDIIQPLHKDNLMVVTGFIVDDFTGEPSNKVEIYTADKKAKTVSDAEGYFQLIIPLAENESEVADRGIILFEKENYITEIRQQFDMWSNGDMIIQIRMKNGKGANNESVIQNREASRTIYDKKAELNINIKDASPSPQKNSNRSQLLSVSCVTTIRVGSNCSPCAIGCSTVNIIAFETYIKRVLPQEWLNCWGNQIGGMNSLQAGAVAIRTYALWRIANPLTANYDICDNPCCQAYGTTQSTNSNNAVDSTVNYILTDGSGNIMKSEYAAEQNNSPTCGNGKKGDGSGSWPCTLDQPCTGQTYNGHGRGMCQNGSARWATGLNLTNSTCTFGSSHGYGTKTWQQILSFYYPNWTLTTCSGTVVTPPSYDEPCNADPLTVDTSCNYVTKTIINATKSSQIPDASCDQPSNVDVWFKFTIPSETFRIHTNSISISSNDCGLAIYTGTCSSMIERYCVKGGNPSQPYMPWDDNINLSAYASQTAYIRIWEYGTVSQTGDFQICVTLTPTNETDHNTSIIPKFYKVSQNYPNPFNPSTIIMYDLPEGGMVSIKIYDMLGREVRTLVNEYKNAGSYNVEFNASNLPSGTYFYCLQAGSFAETKKLVLLR